MARLIGKQKISSVEAQSLRQRYADWPGASGDFVTAEAVRFSVNRETIRRILRGETHTGLATAFGSPPGFPAAPAPQPDARGLAEVEESARRLLESLGTPAGDVVVDAFRRSVDSPGSAEEPAASPPAEPTQPLNPPEGEQR